MRSRPTFLHKFFGAEPDTPEYGVVRWLNGRVGGREIDHFTRGMTVEGFSRRDGRGRHRRRRHGRPLGAGRADLPTTTSRRSPGTTPKRLIGIASVDPVELGRDAAVAEASAP